MGMVANYFLTPIVVRELHWSKLALRILTQSEQILAPLARLIAKAKITEIDFQVLDLSLKDFNDFAFQFGFGSKNQKHSVVLPEFHNPDFWFNKSAQAKLAIIKSFIGNIEQKEVVEKFGYMDKQRRQAL